MWYGGCEGELAHARVPRAPAYTCISVAFFCSAPSSFPCLLPLLLAPRAFLLGAQVAVAGIARDVWWFVSTELGLVRM